MKVNRSIISNLSEDIPNPKHEQCKPCNEKDFENRPILTKLSCLAKENGIFVVANMFDRQNCEFTQACDAKSIESCTENINECPDDGNFYYNTNVVFNREGELVARYYKRHLYFEAELKSPDFPENVYFETDFGNFTTVICFDLIFKDSVDAVKKPDVANLAYPTYWMNHVPFLFFASSFQQAFAMTNKINLLAANVHDPRTGTLGSGIYSGDKGALIYTNTPNGHTKLLISNVPKIIDETAEKNNLNAKRFIIQDDTVTEEIHEESNSWTDCSTEILGQPSDNLTDYRCFPAPPNSYEFVKLEGTEGVLEVCSNAFCCSLLYQAMSMDEEYFLGYTGKPLNLNTYEYGSEICFLARCETVGGVPCSNFKLQSHTTFQKIQIKGNFSTQFVYPFALNSGVSLIDRDYWSFNDNNEILYENLNFNSSVMFLGLYGRLYDKDKENLSR